MKAISVSSYVKCLLTTFGIMAVLFWVLALYLEPVVGDLTRTGRWSENDFGWHAPQPAINIVTNGRATVNPDIVVLGDSFSLANYWQSALSSNVGKKILTFGYGDVGCIDNWIRWSKDNSAAKIVILQVVERNFISSFRTITPCKESTPVPIEVSSGKSSSQRTTWPPTLDAKYLFLTALNTMRMNASPNASIAHGEVINAPIRPGCARFSNKRSDRLLHIVHDNRKENWNDQEVNEAVANVRKLKDEITRAGKKFIFVVAPNKLTAYQECLVGNKPARFPDVTRQLNRTGVDAPDLISAFKGNIDLITDLYYPNNTHWSESGYQLAAETIAAYVLP